MPPPRRRAAARQLLAQLRGEPSPAPPRLLPKLVVPPLLRLRLAGGGAMGEEG